MTLSASDLQQFLSTHQVMATKWETSKSITNWQVDRCRSGSLAAITD